MTVILSERAQAVLAEASATRLRAPPAEEIRSFLREIQVPAADPFVECLSTVGGLDLRDPFDWLHFHSFDEIRMTPNARRKYFEYEDGAWWLNCVESKYPGYCFMHESGSLHFEPDSDQVWAPSLLKAIEGHAFLAPLNSADELHELIAPVKVNSLDDVLTITGALLDETASHPYKAYCRWKGGAIVVLNISGVEHTGKCSIRGYLQTFHAAKELRNRIDSISTVIRVRQLRKSKAGAHAYYELS